MKMGILYMGNICMIPLMITLLVSIITVYEVL